jgi:hypothetical protein
MSRTVSLAFLSCLSLAWTAQTSAQSAATAPVTNVAVSRPAATQPVGGRAGSGLQAAFQQAWDRYTVIVWRFKTPPVGPELKASLESAGIHAVHLDGSVDGVSPETVKFLQETGFTGYLDHGAGKGYLHLVPPDSDKVKGQLEPVARPHCLSDPATMDAMKAIIKKNVEAARKTRVVGYAFDDEISAVSFGTPCDTCTSKYCLERFRRMLKRTYKDIDSLNHQWGTEYENFGQVSIYGCEKTRLENQDKALDAWNLSGWVDSREYVDQNFADTLKELVAFTNKLDPTRPAGYVGSGASTAYGGYDYEKICKVIQWIEAYDIGGSDAIIRSLMPKNPRVQTWFDNKSIEKNKWFNWYYWAQGDRGQIIWPATDETNPWFNPGQARKDIQALKPMLVETQGDKLGRMLVGADFATDGIAVYLSQPSIRVSWFIDILPHKETWINRASSMNNANDTAHWNRYGWMKLLEDCGFSYNFVTPSQVTAGELSKYKVLILGHVLALSDAEAQAIQAFADGGGTVIADHLCGVFDEHGKARNTGALDELFGVTHALSYGLLNGKVLYEVDAEKHGMDPIEKKVATAYEGAPTWKDLVVYERALGVAEGAQASGKADDIPVVVKKGRAVYLNLTPVAYTYERYNPKMTCWPELITGLLAQANVKPRAKVIHVDTGDSEAITQCLYWKVAGGRTALCLVKNLFRSAQIDAAGETVGRITSEPTRIRLVFASPVKHLKNERTGKDLGNGGEFEDTWTTCEANVYTFE